MRGRLSRQRKIFTASLGLAWIVIGPLLFTGPPFNRGGSFYVHRGGTLKRLTNDSGMSPGSPFGCSQAIPWEGVVQLMNATLHR